MKPKPDPGSSAEEEDPGRHAEEEPDWRADVPWRRSPQEIYSDLRIRFWWAQVMIPHVIAVVLGAGLFILAALKTPGFQQFRP